jgi:hypothetical protein
MIYMQELREPSFHACGRIIRLHARPLSRQQIASLSWSSGCRRSSFLAGEGAGLEPNHMTARKLGPLLIVQSSLSTTINTGTVCGCEVYGCVQECPGYSSIFIDKFSPHNLHCKICCMLCMYSTVLCR